jgi:hypothetical protein
VTIRSATLVALVLQVVLGAISTLLFVAAFRLRTDWFADPARLIEGGATSALLLRWGSLTDLFSYYLPTGVVAVALFVVLRRVSEPAALAGLVAALGCVVAGGAGAAALAMAAAPLVDAWEAAGPAERPALAVAFSVLVDVVFRAVWQLLDGVLLATWMATTGMLVRADQPGFARLSFVLALMFATGAALNAVGLGLARDASLGVVFVLWAAWDIVLARMVWRRQRPFDRIGGHGAP